MGRNAILKEVVKERKNGRPPEEVYRQYQGQIKPDKALAMAIASVPDPELKQRYAIPNYVLVALLIVAAVFKVVSVFFLGLPPAFVIGVLILGVVVPVIFAIAVYQFDGRVYPILVILCIVNMLNVIVRNEDSFLTILPDLVFLGVIVAMTLYVKSKIFPNIGFLSVKKDHEGNYAW